MRILWPEFADSPPLSSNELHVWAVSLDCAAADADRAWPLLADGERQRANQFQLEEPRRRFVIARAALRVLLARQLHNSPSKIAISMDSHGKPRLQDNTHTLDLRFNVAHSGDLALIALSRSCEVGVDVERLRPVRHAEHIARRYFHPNELAAIAAAPPAERDAVFLRIWTAKEAVLKALGTGITGSLADFCVPDKVRRGAWIESPSARCWLEPLMPCDGYFGSIVSVGFQPQVRCFALEKATIEPGNSDEAMYGTSGGA